MNLKYVIEHINKSDGTILGYVSSSNIIDGAGDVILNDEFVKMVDAFMLAYGKGEAMVKANHEIDNVGIITQSVILDTEDGRKKWMVGVKVTDVNVLEEIKTQGVSGFSIGGAWKREEREGVYYLSDIKLDEFSILYPSNQSSNRPCNQESIPIMKTMKESIDRIIFGIKSLNHKIRGEKMKELEELQTSLNALNESIKSLTEITNANSEQLKGVDTKFESMKAEFQKSLDEMKSAIPETITGIVTPLFEDHKSKQAEAAKAIEESMTKSLTEKVDAELKEIVKSAQTYNKKEEPDTRSAWEKAAEWREKENSK